jgi:hypothetical protein
LHPPVPKIGSRVDFVRSDPPHPSAANSSLHHALGPSRTVVRLVQRESTRRALRQAAADSIKGAARVVRATQIPTRKGILDFLTYQLIVNAVAWTAGLFAAGLVTNFYEVKALRNLWGLTASGGRTLVSVEHYQSIMAVASFSAGLLMMIFVRHFLLHWIDEVRSLRLERVEGERRSADVRPSPVGSPAPDPDSLDA